MSFDYDSIPAGYYDLVFRRRRGMQDYSGDEAGIAIA